MSATPKPKVRPVTRWMVATLKDGKWTLGFGTQPDKALCRKWGDMDHRPESEVHPVRVRITPLPPRKKAKKGAGR